MNDSNRRPADQARRQVDGDFTNGPPAFAQSNEIKALLRKHRNVQLGMVAVAAGFPEAAKTSQLTAFQTIIASCGYVSENANLTDAFVITRPR
jgi:hypothetical protein